jgi:phosphoribosylanthranilate isomerase
MSGLKLKVCGMREADNIAALRTLAPDYMGMIFWPESLRYVTTPIPATDEPFERVGVFVDAQERKIKEAIETHQLDLLQLHGKESPESCAQLEQMRPVIKAFSVGPSFDFQQLEPYENACSYFLFDTRGPLPGGNGKGFDWTHLEGYPSKKPFFLSGGIGPESIAAIKKLQNTPLPLHAIDVNSKFETAAGVKNIPLLQQFKKEYNVV